MAFEYEALVGYLYVVGGRAISAAPPGTLVEVAPLKAARGREADTVFTMVMPSGQHVVSASFYNQMAQLATERYFNSTGSVTSGLREVFNTLNQNLYDHNQKNPGKHYEANLLCAVLRGSDLIVGRVGPCVMVVNYQGKPRTFPEDLSNDEGLYTAPLGVHPVPNVRMAQFRIASGTRMIAGDATLADFDFDNITGAMMAQDLGMTLVAFKELAKLQLSVLAVQFVPPDDPDVAALPVGQSTTEVEAKLRAANKPPADAEPESAADKIKSRRQERSKELENSARRGISAGFFGLSWVFRLLNRIFDHFFPPPKEGERNVLATPLGAGMVVLVPITVVLLVIFLWLSDTGESAFEICLDDTVNRAETARGIPSSERETSLAAWDQVLIQVDNCQGMRADDPTINAIEREAQQYIDGLNQIERREAFIIDSFFSASLTRIVAQGQDLYVMDEANGIIYRVQLTPDGRERVQRGQPIIQSGTIIDGRQVGEFIDIAFSEDSNRIISVDSNGTLVGCTPLFLDCQAQQLLGVENWSNPVAVTIWNGRLYILDARPGGGQIWRYEPSAGTYPNLPSEVFGGFQTVVNPVDMAIDAEGSIYILQADGIVNKFRSGEPLPFNFTGFPIGQEMTSANAMHLDDSPAGQRLYFVNQPRRTIHETSLAGFFNNNYRTFDEDLFVLIEDVTTTPNASMVYVVSGNAILAFDRNG